MCGHKILRPDSVYTILMVLGAVMKQKNVLVHSCFLPSLTSKNDKSLMSHQYANTAFSLVGTQYVC